MASDRAHHPSLWALSPHPKRGRYCGERLQRRRPGLPTRLWIPLAVTQAAAFISRNVMTVADYLRVFQTSESGRMRQLSIELQDPRRERGFPNSVFRTWRLSFDQMRQRDLAAATLLDSAIYACSRSTLAPSFRHGGGVLLGGGGGG